MHSIDETVCTTGETGLKALTTTKSDESDAVGFTGTCACLPTELANCCCVEECVEGVWAYVAYLSDDLHKAKHIKCDWYDKTVSAFNILYVPRRSTIVVTCN